MKKLSTIGCASLLAVASCGRGGGEPSREDLVQALAELDTQDPEDAEACSLAAKFLTREELVELYQSQPAGFFNGFFLNDEIPEEDQAVLDEYGVTMADLEALFADEIDRASAEIIADSVILSCSTDDGDGPEGPGSG